MKCSPLRSIAGDAPASLHRFEALPITIRAVVEESPAPSDIVTVAEIVSTISKPPPGGWPVIDPSAFEVQPTAPRSKTKPSVRMPGAEQATRHVVSRDFGGLHRPHV